MTCSRRDALKGLAGLGASAVAAGCSTPEAQAVRSRFTAAEVSALEAAMERLVPGSVAAGAMDFIEYWLAHAPFEVVERYLVAGALELDTSAARQGASTFAGLSQEAQDDILKKMAAGQASTGKFDSERFFRQLLELTLESFYGHPKYGGNRDKVGWKLIGLPDGLRSCWWNPNGLSTVLDPNLGFSDE